MAGGNVLARVLGAVVAPRALEHLREAVDDNVQKAADAQANDQRRDDQQRGFAHVACARQGGEPRRDSGAQKPAGTPLPQGLRQPGPT